MTLETPTFETLKETRIHWREGRDIVVALRRSPEGHAAVDVREHVTPEAYPTQIMRGPVGKAKPNRKVRGTPEAYVGPTKVGWWMVNPSALVNLADAIARYGLELEAIQSDES